MMKVVPEAQLEGVKSDQGKPRLSMFFSPALAPAVTAVVRILEYGAKKYPEMDNWARVEKGEERYRDALLRHLSSRISGEIYDPESKMLHSAHIACNAMFLTALELIKGISFEQD